jgi:tripartite-type tricarboxylate transporter receptor subunit TctC
MLAGFRKLLPLCLFCLCGVNAVPAQEIDQARFPERPVNLVVAFSPGGTVDLAFRLMAREMERTLGQPVVVLNRPGGGGNLAVAAIAAARPDGYTIGQVPGQTIFVMPYLEKLPNNPATDLTFIAQFAEANFAIVVRRDSPYTTLKDLIAAARRNPDKLTYGTNAATGVANLVVEQIAKKDNVHFTNVPFKGSPEAQAALLGEHIAFTAGEFNASLVENGPFRVLALFADRPRVDYPQVPTLKDLGYDIPAPVFHVIAGPKGMPEGIVRKLDDAVARAVREARFIKGAQELRVPVVYRNSRELTEYVSRNYEFFGRLLAEMGLAK